MYSYEGQKKELFTDEGQRIFLKVRDKANALLLMSGAFRIQECISTVSGGDVWTRLACIDRLVELDEIRELTGETVVAQYRVFVRK